MNYFTCAKFCIKLCSLSLPLTLTSLAFGQAATFNIPMPAGTAFVAPTPGKSVPQACDQYGNCRIVALTAIPVIPVANPTPGTWVRQAIPAATVPSAYTPVVSPTTSVTGLSNASNLKLCRYRNGTNQPISCSFDGTNDDVPNIAGPSNEWQDFESDGLSVNTSIVCKYTSAAPTTGTFYINCGK